MLVYQAADIPDDSADVGAWLGVCIKKDLLRVRNMS